MTWIDQALAWLEVLPRPALLGAMSVLSAIENIFPPIPADVLVAFGGFLSARTGTSPWTAFAAVWGGNMVGAGVMYLLGRRFGAARIEARYHLTRKVGADARVLALHQRYGSLAFFLSRFIPGVRAVVAPIAGALKLPFGSTFAAIGLASAVWYGVITWLAFRAGANWDVLRSSIGRFGAWSAGAALALVAIAVLVWLLRRQPQNDGQDNAA